MSDDDSDRQELVAVFSEIARQLQSQSSLQETWQRISELAVQTAPNAQHAALSIVHRNGRISTEAATDDVGRAVDVIQYETQQGPCLDAIRKTGEFVTDDLTCESRWPDFSSRAAEETGVRSMMSFQLFDDDATLGALNVYSARVAAFDDYAMEVGRALSAHGAVAMAAAKQDEKVDQLETALDTNRQISMAVGFVMATSNIDEGHAFDVLRAASQRLNLPIGIVAERVIAGRSASTGREPPATTAV